MISRIFNAALVIVCLRSHAQMENGLDQAILNKIDSISTADVPRGSPGVATAIIQGDHILYEKYHGFADLNDSTLISHRSRFNIASNGKQFTALAILLLEKKNKLSLRDDIRIYFPTLFKNIKEPITIENLINHSSGIRDVYDLLALQGITWWKRTMSTHDVFQMLEKQQQLNFEPGTRYLYSNSNYILLSRIVEAASGETFGDFTTKMFRDLNMVNTSFENDYQNIRGPIAKPYFNFTTWSNYNWIWNVTGDGNLFSTLPDLIHWELLINGSVECAIDKTIIRRSQQLTSSGKIKNYGFGLEFKLYKGLNVVQHEGATGAWKAFVVRVPEKKLSLITVTNSGKVIPSYQTALVLDAMLGLKKSDAPYGKRFDNVGKLLNEDSICGVYTNGEAFYFEFLKKEGELFLRRNGRSDVKLVRESTNTFRQLYDSTFKQEFKINEAGDFEVTAYHPSHAPYSLVKRNVSWKNFDFHALAGKYVNSETGAIIEIKPLSGQNYSIDISGRITNGLLISHGELLVNSYLLTFASFKTIDRIYLNGDRIKNVEFVRE